MAAPCMARSRGCEDIVRERRLSRRKGEVLRRVIGEQSHLRARLEILYRNLKSVLRTVSLRTRTKKEQTTCGQGGQSNGGRGKERAHGLKIALFDFVRTSAETC